MCFQRTKDLSISKHASTNETLRYDMRTLMSFPKVEKQGVYSLIGNYYLYSSLLYSHDFPASASPTEYACALFKQNNMMKKKRALSTSPNNKKNLPGTPDSDGYNYGYYPFI